MSRNDDDRSFKESLLIIALAIALIVVFALYQVSHGAVFVVASVARVVLILMLGWVSLRGRLKGRLYVPGADQERTRLTRRGWLLVGQLALLICVGIAVLSIPNKAISLALLVAWALFFFPSLWWFRRSSP